MANLVKCHIINILIFGFFQGLNFINLSNLQNLSTSKKPTMQYSIPTHYDCFNRVIDFMIFNGGLKLHAHVQL